MSYGLGNLNILLVDDDRSMRLLIHDILKAFGVGDVRTAVDGSAALQEMRYYAADIVILDWLMEPMDGMEFLKRIRTADDTPNAYVPIIMLTAYTEISRVQACRDAGITEFLAKPVAPEAIYSRIISIIENQRSYVKSDGYFGPDRRRLHRSFIGSVRREGSVAVNLDDANWSTKVPSAA